MSFTIPHVEPLLAAWSDLGNRFSGRHAELHWTDIVTMLAVVVGGLGFVAALYLLQLRQQRRAVSNEPVHLFQDLCQIHELSWKQRRLLTRLARAQGVNFAAELFVSPHLFDPEQLPSELVAHEVTLQKIADRLFAGLEEPIPAASWLESDLGDSVLEASSPVLAHFGALSGASESSPVENLPFESSTVDSD